MSFFKFLLIIFIVVIMISCEDTITNNDTTTSSPEGMVLINMKDQSFEMGSNYDASEQPIRTVSFTKNIWMDTTEVTQSKYTELMSKYYSDYDDPEWHNPYGEGENKPVYSVYWGDAALYCNAKSKENGLDTIYCYSSISGTPGKLCELNNIVSDLSKNGYRLPTEAEWEFACRAGSTTDLFWGKNCEGYSETADDTVEISSYAIWGANSFAQGTNSDYYGVQNVAGCKPNSFGLYDMAGNVFEWCHDYWSPNYSDAETIDPSGPITGNYRSIRGGSWGNNVTFLRSSNRIFEAPAYVYYFLGFRTVLPE